MPHFLRRTQLHFPMNLDLPAYLVIQVLPASSEPPFSWEVVVLIMFPIPHLRTVHTVLTPKVSSASNATIRVDAPRLDQDQVQMMEATCLFGKAWGEYFRHAAVIARMKKGWNFIRKEVSFRFLGNGWFLIKFSNPLDKEEVWRNRRWFMQGLNFVLFPWRTSFKA